MEGTGWHHYNNPSNDKKFTFGHSVVSASTICVHGSINKGSFIPEYEYFPIDEKHPCKPREAYGLSKVVVENIAEFFNRCKKLETIIIRFGLVFLPEKEFRYQGYIKPDGWWKSIWAYIHVFDVATAFRLAAEQKGLQHEIFFVSAEDNGTREKTYDLLEKFYPSTPIRCDLSGRKSLINYSKATQILGYKPKYSWKDIVKGEKENSKR